MNQKHIPILIGIALPIIFILIISTAVYLPSFLIKPQHNFIYTSGEKYIRSDQMSKYTYDVSEGKIVTKNNPKRYPEQILLDEKPPIYVYDVKTNTSREISFEDAQKLTLDPGPASPDGYTVVYEYGHNGVFELFGSNSDSSGFFVTNGKASKKLTGFSNLGRYWGYDEAFQFIGWIK